MEIAVTLVMMLFAFWRNDFIVYIISAVIIFVLAPECFVQFPELALMFVVVSCYFIAQAVIMAAMAGGTAEGWSQFKDKWEVIKDVF